MNPDRDLFKLAWNGIRLPKNAGLEDDFPFRCFQG